MVLNVMLNLVKISLRDRRSF